MVQLYFLSILCNGLSGYILFAGNDGDSYEKDSKSVFNNPTFHLVLGILSAVTGLLKLLSPMYIPVVGDLIPAAAGLTAGLILIFGMYRQNSSDNISGYEGSLNQAGANLLKFRKSIGIAFMVIALAHFLFPMALFL